MNELVKTDAQEIMEAVISKGDLSKLTPAERNTYYDETCRSVGLNPLTRPFEYITLQGKQTLYARRDACDQLRKIHGVSIKIVSRELKDGMIIVHVHATDKTGREDEDLGVIPAAAGAADVRANQMMKAITKAKRRVTLSICGLGFPDESEIEDIAKEEKKASRKIKTVTSAEKPKELAPPDDTDIGDHELTYSNLGDHELTYEDSRPESPADTAGASNPKVPPDASAVLSPLDHENLKALVAAAQERGSVGLDEEWEALHHAHRKKLEQHAIKILQSYRAIAKMADAKKGKKSETLI